MMPKQCSYLFVAMLFFFHFFCTFISVRTSNGVVVSSNFTGAFVLLYVCEYCVHWRAQSIHQIGSMARNTNTQTHACEMSEHSYLVDATNANC